MNSNSKDKSKGNSKGFDTSESDTEESTGDGYQGMATPNCMRKYKSTTVNNRTIG